MIISIAFSNFYSFFGQTKIDFEVGKKPAISTYDISIGDSQRLNKVVAVVGANGSGKTQFIKPLAFISWFVSHSFLSTKPESPIPIWSHALNSDELSSFEIRFLIENIEYKYILKANRNGVVHESLHQKTSHLFSYIFVREETGLGYNFKQKGFGFSASQAKGIRKNASLIAAAHSFDVKLAARFVDYFGKFAYNLNVGGRQHFRSEDLFESAKFLVKYNEHRNRMQELMCEFDLGICSVKIHEGEAQDNDGIKQKVYVPIAVHESPMGNFELPFFEESSGTQSAFVLLRLILPVLADGGIAVVDEIDNDLHPHMLPQILDLFKFEHTNPKNAQLIFTCHTPEVLNLLKKHQCYLVSKENQQSDAWRLDNVVGLRSDDNIYAKYMAGALGAIPNF